MRDDQSMRCPNCDALWDEAAPRPRFCSQCGQPTRWYRFSGSAEALKLVLTVGALIFRPGFLTLEWIAGRRNRYVLPRPLFVTAFVLFLAVVKVVPIAGGPAVSAPIAAAKAEGSFTADFDDVVSRLQTPSWVVLDRVRAGLSARAERASVQLHEMGERGFLTQVVRAALPALYYASLLLLPLQAALLWLVYRDSGRGYGEHLVFAAHNSSSWALFLMVAYASTSTAWAIGWLLAAAVRSGLETRAVYGRSAASLLRRAMVLGLSVVQVTALLGLLVWFAPA